ncbi:MAG: CPBP family intramembrane metalloprotease [Pirellulales bacterium]|nr:CPBP family intramembrane metalloprotease [Pirellulales bacterium]
MNDPNEPNNGFKMAVLVEGGLAIAALVFAWLFGTPLREFMPSGSREAVAACLRGTLATLPLLAAFWWLVHSRLPALRELRAQVEGVIHELFPTASIAQLVLIAVLAGVGEELLFRGVLQSKITVWTTPFIGIVLTSLLFGAAHALSKTYFVFAIFVGGYLGWFTLYYHDLFAPMMTHALYDFVALVYLTRHRKPLAA